MRSRRALGAALVAVLAAVCAGNAAAGEGDGKNKGTRWRRLGYDLASTFHNPRSPLTPKRAATLETAWQYEAPQSVNGAPAVVGNRVYVLSRDALVALDADSGSEIWKRDDIGGSSSPTVAGGVLYALGGDPTLWAVDAETGEDVWSVLADDQEFASGFSSPVVTKKAVIVGLASIEEVAAESNATYRGGVAAFDRATGAELWRYRTAEPPYNGVGVWSTVSVDLDTGTVFATTGNNYTEEAGPTSDAVIALDLETGEPRWIRQVSAGDVFTVPSPKSQDSDFGTNPILFEAEIGGEQRPLVGAGQKSGIFWALDRETGEIVWQRQVSDGSALIGGVFNNGAYDGKRIIVAGNNGPGGPGPGDDRPRTGEVGTSVLMALDPATGEIEWQRPLDNYVWAPITIADRVGFVAVDLELQAFDTKTGEQLFGLETVGTISSAPVIAGDRIYFGSGLGYIGPTTEGQTVYALEG
ncbi:MAG: outer membrane protein assembly factor BamB family protein [Actinomycetota bacterium]